MRKISVDFLLAGNSKIPPDPICVLGQGTSVPNLSQIYRLVFPEITNVRRVKNFCIPQIPLSTPYSLLTREHRRKWLWRVISYTRPSIVDLRPYYIQVRAYARTCLAPRQASVTLDNISLFISFFNFFYFIFNSFFIFFFFLFFSFLFSSSFFVFLLISY